MEKMSIHDIQTVSLELLKDLHDFCVSKNIRYSLAYGTLIGAIRHKGFIPWDEDVDIWMPRPDYERFIDTYQSSENILKTSYKDNRNFLDFARLYEIKKTSVHGALTDNIQPTGVWIDIFPIDAVSDNEEIRSKEYQGIKKIWWNIRELRRLYTKKNRNKSIKARIHYTYRTIRYGKLFSLIEKSNSLCAKYSFGETAYCASLMCRDAFWKNKIEIFPTFWFQDFTLTEFEGKSFYVANHYDDILKSIYGNYMKLPPEEQRVPKQDDHEFLWIDK